MIPYAELEQAINRWKSRKSAEASGEAAPVPELMAGPPPEEARPVEAAAPVPSESKVSESGEISLGDDMLMEEDQ